MACLSWWSLSLHVLDILLLLLLPESRWQPVTLPLLQTIMTLSLRLSLRLVAVPPPASSPDVANISVRQRQLNILPAHYHTQGPNLRRAKGDVFVWLVVGRVNSLVGRRDSLARE
jgi:hypothetical protein